MADNGVHATEEDPAAAFLAQQENEIAVIENDDDGFGALEGTDGGGQQQQPPPQEPLYGPCCGALALAPELALGSPDWLLKLPMGWVELAWLW